jgi:hypothetical protein
LTQRLHVFVVVCRSQTEYFVFITIHLPFIVSLKGVATDIKSRVCVCGEDISLVEVS